MYADVLVEYGVKSLDRSFTYLIPEHLNSKLKKGMKVVVPFGNQVINGFVINIKDKTETENLKEIISITSGEFVLNDELLELGKYLKEVSMCSLITAYNTMFPSSMKVKNIKSNYNLYDIYLELVNKEAALKYIETSKRAIKRNELLTRLLNKEIIMQKEYSSAVVKPLLEEKLIYLRKETKYRINQNVSNISKPKLSLDQEKAVSAVKLNQASTYLIHGITGSGKTEVYMSLIEKVIASGKTAIMLVPEISLTTQIVNRFYSRFGSSVAIFHSALSAGERHDEYKKIFLGEVKIVVGTRSAVFVPLQNIGIIVIDEEHSTNYKQENNPRYHALDIAKKRSLSHNAPLVLGSATPSLESYARSQKEVYKLITLDKRIGDATLPKITIIDMASEYKKRNMIISDALDKAIKEKLKKKEQIMLFLNRRGFTRIVTCKNCGYTFKCPHCEITLTYHKTSDNLKCHYCGYTVLNEEKCPTCKEHSLTSYGLGTEKLEAEIKEKYLDARVIRMDADTTTKKGSHEKIITMIENEEVDIVLGTQMISKGLDFPKVTLVGVINADDSLNIPDFRSGEYTFSLLSQVSGRAGRSTIPGEVIIQTFNPDDKTLNFVKQNDYLNLYNYEMNIRRLLKYPPYFYLTSIKITSKDYKEASTDATNVLNYLKRNLDNNVIILGPTTAAMFKINNIYRFQIILKYKDFNYLKDALKNLDEVYSTNKKVSLEIDINPARI
ncbi:MAG: primosomal protein N' [Bacilli bacterium]|nr:primosomal protein N' [Bacilli bacterium]MDD4796073.1 primosomal protein N' [Bacilli bacterium]